MKAVEFSAVRVKSLKNSNYTKCMPSILLPLKFTWLTFASILVLSGFISMKNIIFIFLLMVTQIKNDTMLKYLNEGIQCFDTCLAVNSVK